MDAANNGINVIDHIVVNTLGHVTTVTARDLSEATPSLPGVMSAADKDKLDHIAANATANAGTVTSVAALTLGTSGTDLNSSVATGSTTPVITLNVPTASATNRGALSATDWSAFSAKESALSFFTGLTRNVNTITSNLSTGIAGGQAATGGTAAGETLRLSSTTNATKGKILFGTSAYDEANNRLGIGNAAPTYLIDVKGEGTPAPSTTDNILGRFEQTLAARGAGIQIKGYRNTQGNVSSFIDLTNQSTTDTDYIVARMAALRGNTTEGSLLFYTNSGTVLTERMRISSTGAVNVNALGGSGTKLIQTDNSGNLSVSGIDPTSVGTVTSIATNSGLTGGPITTTGTIGIATGGVTSTHILDGTVANIDLATMAANTVKANATASTASPTDVALGTNTVLGRLAGNIVPIAIGTGANDIAIGNHTHATLSQGTGITSFSYNGSAAKTIALANTTVSAGSYGSASAVPTYTVDAQGRLTAASNTTIAIPGTAVTSAVANATTAVNFSGNLAGEVTGTQGATVIAANAVTSGKILDGTIATADIANKAIDGSKLGIGTTNGDILYYNGTSWVRLPAGTNGHFLKSNGTAAPSWVAAPSSPITYVYKEVYPVTIMYGDENTTGSYKTPTSSGTDYVQVPGSEVELTPGTWQITASAEVWNDHFFGNGSYVGLYNVSTSTYLASSVPFASFFAPWSVAINVTITSNTKYQIRIARKRPESGNANNSYARNVRISAIKLQ